MEKSKILFVAQSGPYPQNDGKRQRTFALLKALEEKYTIDYVIVENKTDYLAAQQSSVSDSVRFYFIEIKQTLGKRLLKKAGIVFIKNPEVKSFLSNLIENNAYQFVFTRYIQPVTDIPIGIDIISDIDDDFQEVYTSKIKEEQNRLKKLRLFQIYWMNLLLFKNLLKHIKLSVLVKTERIKSNSLVLPNLPFQLLQENNVALKACGDLKILFVGKLSYVPNIKGLLWFLNEVWPTVLKQLPEVQLTIVTSAATEDLELLGHLQRDGKIELKVNANNLLQLYQDHALVIAPIFQGGGSSIKIAEAILMGRPVITTTFGLRGFEEAAEKNLIFANDDPIKFADKVLSTFADQEDLPNLQKTIHTYGQSQFSINRWNGLLLKALENIQ